MRLDDHLMTILTGLVLAILVGIMAQKSDYFIDAFSGDRLAVAEDDSFIVRAGRNQTLDVLLNDLAHGAKSNAAIKVVSNPSCGAVEADANTVRYFGSDECEGLISFAYCLDRGKECAPAKVTLNVRPTDVQVAETAPAAAVVQSGDSASTGDGVIQAFVVTPELQSGTFNGDTAVLSPENVARFLVDDSGDLGGVVRFSQNVAVTDQSPIPIDPTRSADFLANDGVSDISAIRHATSGSSN